MNPEKEAALTLSYGPVVKGIVIEAKPDGTGWLQPNGSTSRVFFRQNRIRAAVLGQDCNPKFGAKRTGHGQKPLNEKEDVIFVISEDSRERTRAHLIARLPDWERVQRIGEEIKAKRAI